MSGNEPDIDVDNTSNLTEEERIALVQNDNIRRWGQIIIAFILVGFSLGALMWYLFFHATPEFLTFVMNGMVALVFAGIGAAYAIFGLGRTVGKST